MPLDPNARVIVDAMAATFPPVDFSRSGTENRRLIKEAAAEVIPHDPEPVGSVVDREIPGPAGPIPVRVYRPLGASDTPLPVAAFFHGGGWVVCDLDSHDGMCRAICNASGCVVMAVDYRLAPEHKFPVGVEDAYAAVVWLAEHAAEIGGDPSRLAVVGDSAGGNLAAVVALMARDRRGPALGVAGADLPGHRLLVRHAFARRHGRGERPPERRGAVLLVRVPRRRSRRREPVRVADPRRVACCRCRRRGS